MFEFISTLSESAIFRNRESLDKYSSEQISDMLYLYLIALYMLHENEQPVNKYINKTLIFNNFDHYRVFETDLYMLLHLMKNNRHFNLPKAVTFLTSLVYGQTINVYTYFSELERQLKIRKTEIIRLKRQVTNWKKLPAAEQNLSIKNIIREIRNISSVAEILIPLDKMITPITEQVVSVPVTTIKDIARELGMVDAEQDIRVLAAIDDYFQTLNNGQFSPLSGEHNNASQNTEIYDIAKKHGIDPSYLMKYLSDTAYFDKFQKMASLKDKGDFAK